MGSALATSCRRWPRALRLASCAALIRLAAVGCAHAPHASGSRATPAGAAQVGAATAPASAAVPSAGSRVTVTDLSPKFLAFYDSASARPLDPEARWALWKRLYGFAAVPPTPFGDSLARRLLDAAWPRYRAAVPRIRRGAAALGFAPDTVLDRVVRLLGCGGDTRVRLIAFVGGFEANAFAFGGPQGEPMIALPLEAGDALRSATHEFTHAVHRSSGCANLQSGYGQSLAELVATEGLAMRVVERLVPGHPTPYYLAATQEWLDSAGARREAILRGVGEHLGDTGAATAQRFTFGPGTTGVHREAYYAGWEAIGALLRSGVSLHAIAVTPAAGIQELVARGIEEALQHPAP